MHVQSVRADMSARVALQSIPQEEECNDSDNESEEVSHAEAV